VRRSSPGRTGFLWAPCPPPRALPAAAAPHPSPLVAVMAPWWGGLRRAWCCPAVGGRRGPLLAGESQGFRAEGPRSSVCARVLGCAPGQAAPCADRASPPERCQERLRVSRALRGIPARSVPQRASAPGRCSGPGLAGQRCLLGHPGTLPGRLLRGSMPAVPRPCPSQQRASPPQKPSAHPPASLPTRHGRFPEAGQGEVPGCPPAPVVAGSNPTRARLGVRRLRVGLVPRGARVGDALAVQPWCPPLRNALSRWLPPALRPRTHCSAPCSAGGFGPASSTLGPAAAPRLPSPFHGGRRWCGLPASCPAGTEGRGPGAPPGRHDAALRLRPSSRGSAISCCVADDLPAKSRRGPRARGTASCLRPLPPLAQGTGRASQGAGRAAHLPPRPERSATRTAVLGASAVPIQGVKVAPGPAQEVASVTLCWVALEPSALALS